MDDQRTDGMRMHVNTHSFKRHRVAIAVVAILVTLAVGGFVFLAPGSYSSTATVLLRPLAGNALSGDSSGTGTTVAMQTESSLINSANVTGRVNRALGSKLEPGTAAVKTTVPTNTDLIRITYTAATAATAQLYAQAYAKAFLAYRSDLADTTQKAQLATLNDQFKTAEAQLTTASKAASRKNPPAEAVSKVQLYAARVAALQDVIGQTQSASIQPGTVVSPAPKPSGASGLSIAAELLGGLVVGLGLGLLFAAWRERRDDRIRSAAEVFVVDLPVLATVPLASANSTDAATNPLDADVDDAYRRARTTLLSAARMNSVIAIGAVSAAEPSAAVAVHLARTLAAARYRVVLVDAAVEQAEIASLMGIEAGTGLSDVLAGNDIDLATLSEVDGVRVMTAGTDPVGTREQYSGATLSELLSKLREEADYVLVSTSPMSTSDGLAVVLATDKVALVVTDISTTHLQIAETRDLIRRLGVETLGLIVVRRHKWGHRPAHLVPHGEALQPDPPKLSRKERAAARVAAQLDEVSSVAPAEPTKRRFRKQATVPVEIPEEIPDADEPVEPPPELAELLEADDGAAHKHGVQSASEITIAPAGATAAESPARALPYRAPRRMYRGPS